MDKNLILLTRDDFRNGIFARDGYKCIFCDQTDGLDAHHIIERRLFPDGGYYLNNGATVCQKHHLQCEMTTISVEDVREACGIEKKIIPPHLYDDCTYDKWGNIILPNGSRIKGEIFFDESVQKILKQGGVLDLFTDQVKYPRTHHLPWSGNINEDDRVISSLSAFQNQRVIITTKLDGENTSMYSDYYHARSIDGNHHYSRDWCKNFWSSIAHEIPKGWRICGENLYAQHSIKYDNLESYFYGFSIWNDKNECLPWDETLEWFQLLGIQPVPVIYDGIWDEKSVRELWNDSEWSSNEGYVVRVAESFSYIDFKYKVAKFVRKDHVQTVKHWMYGQPITKNSLKNKDINTNQ